MVYFKIWAQDNLCFILGIIFNYNSILEVTSHFSRLI
nr:MAG TPA: hypothetical protein [Bacteriophage sp.]